MKILYSHRTKSADGQYVHIRALTEALKARGHEVFFADSDGDMESRLLDAGAGAGSIRRLLPKPVAEAAERAYSSLAYSRLAKRARETAPDIIYERYNLFFDASARLARSSGLPLLLEVNAPLAEERQLYGGLASPDWAARNEARIWQAADRVLPVTGVLARMVEAAGVAPERITVIGNAVDQSFLKPADGDAIREKFGLGASIVLGFTGFIREWHQLERAIRYLADRRQHALKLFIVGDGEIRADLEAQARRLSVADRVVFAGVVQRESLAAHVAAFDIALLPAATPYASPLKLFEYMAAGRAIVAPRTENIVESLGDASAALLVDPDDEAAFIAALDTLVGDPAQRFCLGEAASAAFAAHGRTWDDNARLVEKIAEEELSRRR